MRSGIGIIPDTAGSWTTWPVSSLPWADGCPLRWRPLYQQNLRVEKPRPNSRPTRDILYVGGLLPNGDTLDVFVAHFPSRSGGARQTAPYRHNAARRIKSATDSLMCVRRRPQIILMGDFNDPPDNSTVRDVLQALPPPDASNLPEAEKLYHLLARRAAAGRRTGSYKYRGAWQCPPTSDDSSAAAFSNFCALFAEQGTEGQDAERPSSDPDSQPTSQKSRDCRGN